MNEIWVVESVSKRGLKVAHLARTKSAAVRWIKRRGATKIAFLVTRRELIG